MLKITPTRNLLGQYLADNRLGEENQFLPSPNFKNRKMIQFVDAKTFDEFESKLNQQEITDDSLGFIRDTNQIWIDENEYDVIPENGETGEVVVNKNGKAAWSPLQIDLLDLIAYGVQWDDNQADPHLTRIGNISLHKTLPIQNSYRGCIAQGGDIKYYLDDNDWRWRKTPIYVVCELVVTDTVYQLFNSTFFIDGTNQWKGQWVKINNIPCQINGSPSNGGVVLVNNNQMSSLTSGNYTVELGACLNGYDGTVRVHTPAFYLKSFKEGTTNKVYITTSKIDDTWTYQPELLIDAWCPTKIMSSTPDNWGYLSATKPSTGWTMVAIQNTETFARGGVSPGTTNDQYLSSDPFRVSLGKSLCMGAVNKNLFRTYAANTESRILSYEEYKNIFYWPYVIEYANFNSQEPFNEALTTDGFKQGGLGDGVTNYPANPLQIFNYCRSSLIPCGYLNDLGNGTGIKEATTNISTFATNTTYPTKWRGFENIFGNNWLWLDGIVIEAPDSSGQTQYIITDPSKYTNELDEAKLNCSRTITGSLLSGYTKGLVLGEFGDLMPLAGGGSSTTGMCDTILTVYSPQSLTIFWGGGPYSSSQAGIYCKYYTTYTAGVPITYQTSYSLRTVSNVNK